MNSIAATQLLRSTTMGIIKYFLIAHIHDDEAFIEKMDIQGEIPQKLRRDAIIEAEDEGVSVKMQSVAYRGRNPLMLEFKQKDKKWIEN